MPACRFAVPLLLLALAPAACSGRPDRPVAPRPLYSPVGEYLPMAAGTTCGAALERWFDRADANRDARLDLAELRADATRLFAAFDTDQDGYVTPQELLAARRVAAAPSPADPPPLPREGAPPRRGGRIDTSPDPVMAADTNLDFRVSRAEFQAHVERRLQAADAARRGYLTKADLPVLCAEREARR